MREKTLEKMILATAEIRYIICQRNKYFAGAVHELTFRDCCDINIMEDEKDVMTVDDRSNESP